MRRAAVVVSTEYNNSPKQEVVKSPGVSQGRLHRKESSYAGFWSKGRQEFQKGVTACAKVQKQEST